VVAVAIDGDEAIAGLRGLDVEQPRNLAKSVAVE
jgi:glucosamine 6-phosphate synthetase-like amidotransferase/phosphosugar isomerase protein